MGLFGMFSQKDTANKIKNYLEKGAIILDVRTLAEWNKGHSESAKHIVLTVIPLNLDEIKSWGKPVIAVCKSGARSAQATQFLNENGLDALNGGPWKNVDQYLE